MSKKTVKAKSVIMLLNLPKASLNNIYAGEHYSKRKKLKDTYKVLIRNQTKRIFPKNKFYKVFYEFGFKSKPLDTSNTVYMLKMVEDILFEDDTYKIIPELKIRSVKAKEDYIKITVIEKLKY